MGDVQVGELKREYPIKEKAKSSDLSLKEIERAVRKRILKHNIPA